MILILPMFSLHLGQEDIGATPQDTTERQAFDLMASAYGPGYNGPLLTATELSPPAHPSQEYEDKYNQAKANQADLERKQKQLTAESNSLKSQQASLERQQSQLLAEKRQLRQEQAQLLNQQALLRRQAAPLLRQARALAAQAAALRRQANALAAQGAALRRQADQLAAEGAALQRQAGELQAQADSLKQQQQQAEEEKKQTEQLKQELTDELTKAGGDDRGTDPRLVKLQDALATPANVQLVSPPAINKGGDAATFTVIPRTRPADPATADLVTEVRASVIPAATGEGGITAYVGGVTAANVDPASKISSQLVELILVVLALSTLLLLIAFRSLLIPVQAAITNLLCVGAAFGVLVATFQWGWGLDLVGLSTPYGTVPIASYVPLMMFAALFGLSMDYEVFLVSQIAQHHAAGEPPWQAVRSGVASSAKVIAAAAIIMISVFGSFVLNGDPTIKQFGVGLSVAVLLASAMVLSLAPAMLTLFGRALWWLPRWLANLLPHVDIEGEAEPPTPEPALQPQR